MNVNLRSAIRRVSAMVQHATRTRRTRAIEAELARERNQRARKDIEVARQCTEVERQRAEVERLRQQIAQVMADCARLREENRALLNSILGIAGIPPITVTAEEASAMGVTGVSAEKASAAEAAALDEANEPIAAQNSSLGDLAPPPPGWQADVPRSDPPAESGPEATTPATPADDDHPLVATVADGPVLPFGRGAAMVRSETSAHKQAHVNAAARRKKLGRVAPVRRRSWQQIHRALELEAARQTLDRGAKEIDA